MITSRIDAHRGCSDNRACIWIRTLISGFPRSLRERWQFLMLQQAFLDDSGKDELAPVLVVAGYIGTAGDPMDMADRWEAYLDKDPTLTYDKESPLTRIKAYETFGLNGQFAGWTPEARDRRLLPFVSLIKQYCGKGIAFSVTKTAFELIKGLKDEDGVYFTKPEYIAYSLSLSALLQALPDLGGDAIDIVFDYDVVDRRAAKRAYEKIYTTWPVDIPQRLARAEPHFEDDMKFLPLQAADLLAHCIRAHLDPAEPRYDRVRQSAVFAELRSIPTALCRMGHQTFEYLRDRYDGRAKQSALRFSMIKWE